MCVCVKSGVMMHVFGLIHLSLMTTNFYFLLKILIFVINITKTAGACTELLHKALTVTLQCDAE